MRRAPDELSRRGFLGGGFLRLLRGDGERALGVARTDASKPVADAPCPGVARVLPTACIAFRGTLCVTCVERCPLPGAIALEHGRPVIDASTCDGCGVCIEVCPAPQTAIVRVPTAPG